VYMRAPGEEQKVSTAKTNEAAGPDC